MCITTSEFTSAQRGAHPIRELLSRAKDPYFVADCIRRTSLQGFDLLSPSEFSSLYRKVRAYTMCSNSRLRGLYRSVRYVVRDRIPGDIVECGTAQGGSAALMALTLRKLNAQRKMWLFDTFEGLPSPTADDPDFDVANLFTGTCIGTLDEVSGLFRRLDVLDGVEFCKGMFQDLLPITSISQIAVLHIDGDWYESVKICLDILYDRVVSRGVIQFDDYGYWQGARKAVDEFLKQRGIQASLQRLDYSGRLLIKPE